MKVGIGLPNAVRGVQGARLVQWARRAEERGFEAVSTIDRVAYPTTDSLLTLAAVAGATKRIGLETNILLGPVYPPVLLAKAVASLDQLSGGRFTLGLAVGGRPDDYAVAGVDFSRRGRILDEVLELLHRAWRGEPPPGSRAPVTPTPVTASSVPVMIGGNSDAAVRRVATYAVGWTQGGGTPEAAADMVPKIRAAWADAGREGEPRLTALAYFSLGEDAAADSRAYLRDYYAFLGTGAQQIADSTLRSEQAIRAAIEAFAEVGIGEVIFDATITSLDQVDRLADVVL